MQTNPDSQVTALVVDDEPLARQGLLLLLAEDPGVARVLEAKGGREAISLIRDQRPDLVFLDVQMPEMDGLAVVNEIGPARMPAVVFVTAHDQYAIQAFEINAIDYLLKPITRERFAQSLHRAKARLGSSDTADQRIITLLETMTSPPRHLQRVAIRSSGRISFVTLSDVNWIEAAENYVQLHTDIGSHMLRVTIGVLEASLDPATFLRIHRSMMVNVRQVKELESAFHGEYVLTLRCGVRLQSSRTYHERISRWASNPF